MAVDYDLVIIGGTPEGYAAADHAAHQGARVALILGGLTGYQALWQSLGSLWALGHPPDLPPPASPWRQALQRAALIADRLTREDLQRLIVTGVDVIAEQPYHLRDRPLTVETPSRPLRTRAVVLATGSEPRLPAIAGLAAVPYETPDSLWQRQTLPTAAAILGSTPMALMLSQLLCQWGVSVTLITPATTLLNQEDPDVSQWITAQLQAEGVQLRLGTAVESVTATGTGVELQLPEDPLTVDTLIVAVAPGPNLSGVPQELVGSGDRAIDTNRYLQTPHPRIYACGSLLGGYSLPAIARQEALIAVDNALFWNRRSIDYCTLPYGLLSQPTMARVGLTEPQARRRYRETDVLVCRQPLYHLVNAQWRESIVGFCKLIAHRNGRILGVHGVGPEAHEWVQTGAWLIAQQTPWQRLAQAPTLPYSLSELLRQAAQQWHRDRWQPGQWRRDWAENWCNWRRNC